MTPLAKKYKIECHCRSLTKQGTKQMHIAFLHTAEIHVATFDTLLDQLGFEGVCTHKVSPELLTRTRDRGLDDVQLEVVQILSDLASADAVMCTCSTLGPLADQVAERFGHVFRIDRPVMEEACRLGKDVLVAICLQSTEDATLSLLKLCAEQVGVSVAPRVVLCSEAWVCFERGDMDGYAASIAESVRTEVANTSNPDCIILAQASMRVAEPLLTDLNVPVFSSPTMAASRAIQIAENGK